MTLPLKVVLYESTQFALLVTTFREPLGLLLTGALRPFYKWLNLKTDRPLRLILRVLSAAVTASAFDSLIGLGIERLAGRTPGTDPGFGIFCFPALLLTV